MIRQNQNQIGQTSIENIRRSLPGPPATCGGERKCEKSMKNINNYTPHIDNKWYWTMLKNNRKPDNQSNYSINHKTTYYETFSFTKVQSRLVKTTYVKI